MVQIVNISQVRENIATLVKQVSQTKKPIVIVRDSIPSVIMYPYDQGTNKKTYKDALLSITGDWFDEKDYKNIRDEINRKIDTEVL